MIILYCFFHDDPSFFSPPVCRIHHGSTTGLSWVLLLQILKVSFCCFISVLYCFIFIFFKLIISPIEPYWFGKMKSWNNYRNRMIRINHKKARLLLSYGCFFHFENWNLLGVDPCVHPYLGDARMTRGARIFHEEGAVIDIPAIYLFHTVCFKI